MKNFSTRLIVILMIINCHVLVLNAQQIRFKATSITVSEVMKEIKGQTDYGFSYSRRVLDGQRVIELPSTLMDITEVLDAITTGIDVEYIRQDQYIIFRPKKEKEENTPPTNVKPTPTVSITSDKYVRLNKNNFVRRENRPLTEPLVKIVDNPLIVRDSLTTDNIKEYTSFVFPTENCLIGKRPTWAVKINMLYGLGTLTPNLALEVGLGQKTTLELSGSYHPWRLEGSLKNNKKFTHMTVRPEFRYWLCERFNGHFFGVHAFYSHYNIGTYNVPMLFKKEYRYYGYAFGGGLTYGYQMIFNKRWGMEFNVGLGVAHLKYDKYQCMACQKEYVSSQKTYFGPTRAGITLVFNIK